MGAPRKYPDELRERAIRGEVSTVVADDVLFDVEARALRYESRPPFRLLPDATGR